MCWASLLALCFPVFLSPSREESASNWGKSSISSAKVGEEFPCCTIRMGRRRFLPTSLIGLFPAVLRTLSANTPNAFYIMFGNGLFIGYNRQFPAAWERIFSRPPGGIQYRVTRPGSVDSHRQKTAAVLLFRIGHLVP